MKSKILNTVGLVLLLGLSSCLYSNFTAPLDTDFQKTTLGKKTGESSSYSVLGAVAWGDSGSKAAAQNGGITRIDHADRKVYSVLFGLYTKVTTVVYGD